MSDVPFDQKPGAERVDILVAGAGYVGLTTAVAIKEAAPHLSVAIVDAAPDGVWEKDTRASAVAAAAVRMLTQLGIWRAIEAEAQPITEMIVTDSKTGDAVRPVFLTFGGEARPGEPFAHMMPNVRLNGALRARAADLGISIRQGVAVRGIAEGIGHVEVRLSDGSALSARLLVACDGVKSAVRDMAGIRTLHWDYGQSGIVATVAHERPHEGRAEEHFLPSGPFAILPLKGNRSSLVWTEPTREAERLVAADDMVFELELEQRFGHRLGALTVEGPRRAFPLGLTLAREFVRPRIALAGDAAHGIHPIAGQGLNLGFKDAAALAEVVVDAERRGLDIGALDVLETYQRWRRFDTLSMGVTTDVLNRLFSNDNAVLRMARSFGLSLVDRAPPLKDFFIGQAAGLTKGPSPRLLQGEAI
ncbi:ubiquinone biosynthesis hydroxylase [Jiella sonneratiae]|uniref:Ubiquinone biosynthesis hydroxylase n=1 Tax=Jiella sonneratiae TaxID=2816856 RepID=A0ABS3J620_9HYPH|nr:ubiquinone biosynthesis hydroxylase [Jiella sonneratiae]MBO0904403.1 ubiquinone biosynthesis hydroxylase [Jiella sonneratiae]